jgi:hypothetical protein
MEPTPHHTRFEHLSVAVAAGGAASLLAGLAWDARMHAGDAELASREGVLTLANPAHLLAAVGVVLVTAGIAGTAWALWCRPGSRRRRVVAAVALAVLPALAGTVSVASAATESSHHDHGDHQTAATPPVAGDDDMAMSGTGHVHSRDVDALRAAATPAQRAAATALTDRVKAGIAPYADPAAATAAGYRPNPRGGPNATHWPSATAWRDGRVLDPSHPESLVYWTLPDGRKVLLGAMFKVAPGQEAPAPGGDLTMWHVHPAPGQMCHPAEDAGCSGTQMLHVYVFDGVVDPFAENPVAAAGGHRAFTADLRAIAAG